jgi:hypothetical protein
MIPFNEPQRAIEKGQTIDNSLRSFLERGGRRFGLSSIHTYAPREHSQAVGDIDINNDLRIVRLPIDMQGSRPNGFEQSFSEPHTYHPHP